MDAKAEKSNTDGGPKTSMGVFERHVLRDHSFVPLLRHPSASIFRLHYRFEKLKAAEIARFMETSLADRAVLANKKTSDPQLQHEYFILAGVLNFVLLMSEFRYIFVWVVHLDVVRVVDRSEARSTCVSCQAVHSLADGGRACPICASTQCVVCRESGKSMHIPILKSDTTKAGSDSSTSVGVTESETEPTAWRSEPPFKRPRVAPVSAEGAKAAASAEHKTSAEHGTDYSKDLLLSEKELPSDSTVLSPEDDFGMQFPEGAREDVMLRDCPSLTKGFELNLNSLLKYLDNSTTPCTFCGGESVIKCFACANVHFCSLLCRALSAGYGLTGSVMNSLSRTLRPASLAVGTTRCACWLINLGRIGATNQFCTADGKSSTGSDGTLDKKKSIAREEFGALAIRYIASRRVRQSDIQRRRALLTCDRCQKAPAILWCRKCQRRGYCSIACRIVDVPHRGTRALCQGDTSFLGAECGVEWSLLGRPEPKSQSPKSCQAKACGATAAATCERCNSIAYCSSLCQIMDWPRHKLECRASS
jgi:hypothetical protein